VSSTQSNRAKKYSVQVGKRGFIKCFLFPKTDRRPRVYKGFARETQEIIAALDALTEVKKVELDE